MMKKMTSHYTVSKDTPPQKIAICNVILTWDVKITKILLKWPKRDEQLTSQNCNIGKMSQNNWVLIIW